MSKHIHLVNADGAAKILGLRGGAKGFYTYMKLGLIKPHPRKDRNTGSEQFRKDDVVSLRKKLEKVSASLPPPDEQVEVVQETKSIENDPAYLTFDEVCKILNKNATEAYKVLEREGITHVPGYEDRWWREEVKLLKWVLDSDEEDKLGLHTLFDLNFKLLVHSSNLLSHRHHIFKQIFGALICLTWQCTNHTHLFIKMHDEWGADTQHLHRKSDGYNIIFFKFFIHHQSQLF